MVTRYRVPIRTLRLTLHLALVSVAIFLLFGCQDAKPTPKPIQTEVRKAITPEPNFAFALEWTYCFSYTLDTFSNKLTLRSNTEPPITTTIDFVLSKQDLEAIYQKMLDISLLNYPDEFAIKLPPSVIRVYGIAAQYRFDIQSGSQRKAIHWNDEFSEPPDIPWKAEDSEPTRSQAVRLRELIKLIQQIVESRSEFKVLPSPGGCA